MIERKYSHSSIDHILSLLPFFLRYTTFLLLICGFERARIYFRAHFQGNFLTPILLRESDLCSAASNYSGKLPRRCTLTSRRCAFGMTRYSEHSFLYMSFTFPIWYTACCFFTRLNKQTSYTGRFFDFWLLPLGRWYFPENVCLLIEKLLLLVNSI